MDKKKQKNVLAKIDKFLDSQRQFWYPEVNVVYKRKSAYCSFSDRLKREILYTQYSSNELLASLVLKFSSDGKRLDVSFSYKSGDAGIALPDQSILETLQKRGAISNVSFREENEQAENKPNFESDIQYFGKTLKAVGYVEEPELRWLSISEGEEGTFKDEKKLRDWSISILNEWLQDIQPVEFEWLSQNGSFLLQALKEVSEVGVDASSEEEPHVFRWREESLADQCKSSSVLPKQDVEDIIKKCGVEIPKDAELVGLGPHGENTSNPCLRVIYVHTIEDSNAESSGKIPPVYRSSGKVIIEGDFCIFHIDPENQRVFSEFRKWRPIKET